MAMIEINDTSAMSMAAQVFTELTDEQFAMLYNRIVREGKFRRTVDFRALVKKTQRSWSADKERQAKCDGVIDDTLGG